MEALRSDTVRASDSMHSLSCINTHHIDELSKEKEEELLYGAGDDGDEEDALSDDSMRLRLSDDDEIEAEDVLTPALDDQENKSKSIKIEMTSGKDDNMQTTIPEKNIMENDTAAEKIKQEEHCKGNVIKDEEIVTDHGKVAQRSENGLIRPQISNMPRPWKNCDPQWRFARNPCGRSFHNANHPSYNRYRYLTPRGHYRLQSYDYNTRYRNAFFPVERGRGNGMFNTYNRSYGNRQQNKGFKSTIMPKLNSSTELDQNLSSISNTNISPNTEVKNDIKNTKVDDKKTIEKNNTLSSEILVDSDKNNEQSNKLLNEKVENITTENIHKENIVDANSVNDSLELQHNFKENSEIICNDTKCKSITTSEINILNDNSSEKLVNSAINCLDNDKETDKISENSINNADVEPSDFYIGDNSKEVEALNIDVKCKSDKDETIEYTEKNDISNQKKDEVGKTTDIDINENKDDKKLMKLEKEELNTNQQSTERNHETELLESNCNTITLNTSKEQKIVNNELTVNGKVTDHKVEEIAKNKEEEVSLQATKLNKDHEDSALNAITITSSDLTITKDDDEIIIIQNNTPAINSEKCENNQLKSSDNSTNSTKISKLIPPEDQLTHPKINLQEQNNVFTEKSIKPTEKENSMISPTNKTAKITVNFKLALNKNNSSDINPQNGSLDIVIDAKTNSEDNDKKTSDIPVSTQRRRRRTKKMIIAAQEVVSEEEKQVRESGRQKRQTAKNAEEIIRKKYLNHDSDLESSDDSEKFVVVNHKMNQDICPLSPPSLKRNYSDNDSTVMNGITKKAKINSEAVPNELTTKESSSENLKKLSYVHKFFQRDFKEKLPKLKQEELEELLIQKIVETITMRAEIGKLREQARISERNQEVTRAKCQQLAKQIKDFEMVLSRNAADRRANNDKPTPPIKINRSVGLQVNFITDNGMQNLRQLQQTSSIKSLHVSSSSNTLNTSNNETNNASSPRKGIKIRSPRRIEPMGGQSPVVVSQNHTQSPNITSTITPAALVVAKPVDTQHTLTLSNQPNVQQIMSNTQSPQSQQTIVLNGKFPNQINRQGSTTITVAKSRANDLIDLTDEEEKSKATVVPVVTTTITEQVNLAPKTQPCFQRVIQTIPGNVAITSQPPSIRVVQPASQPTPTALVNNMNAPRLAYVMQSSVGPTRQLLIAPNSNPMRPVTSCRASFPTVTYKTGISTIANGTVRVLTTPATSNVQLNKHPAPLPDIRSYTLNPIIKLPPPAPSLKISKVAHGIVLSWNMNLSDKYADIASYQLYAYQEVAGVPPNTSLWKKVGDVRALPLPMACTLTQFSEGNNYYFAVRAVDTHSRKGQYSIPGNISL
ncbi:PREDICTED: activating transcription factor 7-interacting protein 1 [Habropoda laboriosa]|uniref:activating transcription factor 7-interacting protein 1 n=1 Tax=Habropoda laboriosa TaxID=597456 RepID=UPI00083D84F4|nr:PREDICTED: activating transcription factor 7-interacting protein 1 [Habropoda laboriosa]